VVSCTPPLQHPVCCKNTTIFHAKAWQLIVNEFPSNAKALNLLHFLKKINAYMHILSVYTGNAHIYATYWAIYRGVGMGHVGVWGIRAWKSTQMGKIKC